MPLSVELYRMAKAAKADPWLRPRRVALHHAVIEGDLAYASWRDGGLTLLDISDKGQRRGCFTSP